MSGHVSSSARTIESAAGQVQDMVRRLTPLWSGLIAAGGLLLGIVLMYFFVVAGQRRIEAKIDRLQLQQPAPVAVQPAAPVVPPAPATGPGSVHLKAHGSKAPAAKPKTQQKEPAPPASDQP